MRNTKFFWQWFAAPPVPEPIDRTRAAEVLARWRSMRIDGPNGARLKSVRHGRARAYLAHFAQADMRVGLYVLPQELAQVPRALVAMAAKAQEGLQ